MAHCRVGVSQLRVSQGTGSLEKEEVVTVFVCYQPEVPHPLVFNSQTQREPLTLDSGGGDALDELPLEDEEDDQEWECH